MGKRIYHTQKISRTRTVWIAHDHYLQIHLVSQKTTCTMIGRPVKHKITITTRAYKLLIQAFEKRGKMVINHGDALRLKVEDPSEGFPFTTMVMAIGLSEHPDIAENLDSVLEALEILKDRVFTAELKWTL